MNIDTNYGAPFDYYMTNFLEKHADSNQHQFKHYWTTKSFFLQGSNYGLDQSTIQYREPTVPLYEPSLT